MTDDIITALAPRATKKLFKKHSILLYQGEAPRRAYVLLSGTVKVYSINTAGEEQIATFQVRKDLFPSPWIFHKSSTTLYYYEALTDCEVLLLARDDFHTVLSENPQLSASALDYFAANYTGMMMRVTALEQSRARDKIMFTLYYLMFRYGIEAKPGVFVVDLGLTHSVIASLVGLTRETTTTELSKLKLQKVVTYTAHSYTIYKDKLERLLGEDSFSDLTMV